jgi:ATP-dependent RNA helicase DeaD
MQEIQWADMELSQELHTGLKDCGYTTPTEVQQKAIPIALEGKDLIVRSKTGTGKSAAFLIPSIQRTPQDYEQPSCLVLCPSRELAIQVQQESARLATHTPFTSLAIYGGVSIKAQQDGLAKGAQLIAGTPGRVLDLIKRGDLKLEALNTMILDEADEMLSMGFYEEVTNILKRVPKTSQMLLFSASLEERLKKLIGRFLKEPTELYISLDTDQASENVTHVTYNYRNDISKPYQLLYILTQEKPSHAIIFCNTKSDTAMLARFLSQQGFRAQDISSDLSQPDRERVMAKIKAKEIDFLIATDIAARGIDIENLEYVFNYTIPEDTASYLHRSGRTGRIGNTGTAISLVGALEKTSYQTLKTKYQISFEERVMASKEDIQQAALVHQKKRIKSGPAIAYDGYFALAKELIKEGDTMLIAKALCGYMQSLNKPLKPTKTPKQKSSRDNTNKPPRRRKRR